jgi:hypothetical protein
VTALVEPTLEAGTYEVLRARLAEQAAGLARRAEALNARRLEAFGSAELTLLGTERIRTEHNCVPRDVVQVAGLMLFGYNVFIGLKPETTVDDVFSLHRFTRDGDAFRFEDAASDDPADDELPGLLRDPQFERDFAELYRYYRDTRLIQLRRVEGRLLAVFQTGARIGDIRVLRWQVGVDGTVKYLDNRGERDHVFPPSHDFEWVVTGREHHVLGRHPHISIEDEVFVETIGGDLTIKVENNTETGEGVYTEPVDEPLQSLADGEVQYARVGSLILLRNRPYNETAWRHLVFNTRTRSVVRLDGIGQACQRLPEDQGLIFPGGYYLATGVNKTFDTPVDELEFERVIRSTNGEDVLYVFHARRDGRSLLLPYNVIRKEVANPLSCHGYSLFDDGTLVVFRAMSDEPTRVHPMQVWQTPYVSDAYAAAQPEGTGRERRPGSRHLRLPVGEPDGRRDGAVRAGVRGPDLLVHQGVRRLPLAGRAGAGRPAHAVDAGPGDGRAGAGRVRDRAGADRPGGDGGRRGGRADRLDPPPGARRGADDRRRVGAAAGRPAAGAGAPGDVEGDAVRRRGAHRRPGVVAGRRAGRHGAARGRAPAA